MFPLWWTFNETKQAGDTSAGVMIIHTNMITKFKCDYCMRNFPYVMLIKLSA